MATVREAHECEWKSEAESLRERTTALESELAALKRFLFGRRSEKVTPVSEELRKSRPPPAREETLEKRRANKQLKSELPSETVLHPVAAEKRRCPKCGSGELKSLGDGKRTTVFDYVPARLVKRVHVQETLACTCCDGIVTAEGAPKAIEKGQYGPGLIAHVVTAKCADSIPLYRQAKALQRAGIPIARTTLGDLFHAAANATEPLWRRLLQLVALEEVVRADETPMRILAKGKTRRGYLWTFRTEKLIAFSFSASRSGETPFSILGATKGYLLVDGYTGYNSVTVPSSRIRAGCWAHARRRFFEARSTAPEAERALSLIRELYRIEETAALARIHGTAEHLSARWLKSAPVLRELEAWLANELPRHPPKSPLGDAIRYAQGQWPALTRFLENPRIPLDNNASESALRTAALGRKNYLFVGHDEAGQNIAGLYSLVASCEANGINPEAYLADVLLRVSTHPHSAIDELLPHRWAPERLTNSS